MKYGKSTASYIAKGLVATLKNREHINFSVQNCMNKIFEYKIKHKDSIFSDIDIKKDIFGKVICSDLTYAFRDMSFTLMLGDLDFFDDQKLILMNNKTAEALLQILPEDIKSETANIANMMYEPTNTNAAEKEDE